MFGSVGCWVWSAGVLWVFPVSSCKTCTLRTGGACGRFVSVSGRYTRREWRAVCHNAGRYSGGHIVKYKCTFGYGCRYNGGRCVCFALCGQFRLVRISFSVLGVPKGTGQFGAFCVYWNKARRFGTLCGEFLRVHGRTRSGMRYFVRERSGRRVRYSIRAGSRRKHRGAVLYWVREKRVPFGILRAGDFARHFKGRKAAAYVNI